MTKSTRDRIGDIFGVFVTDEDELAAVFGGAPILAAVSLDSLTMLKLITELEVEFGKRFDMDTIEQVLETIDSLAAYLDS
jgi:hypothetical protein